MDEEEYDAEIGDDEDEEPYLWFSWASEEILLYNPHLRRGLVPIRPVFDAEPVPGTLRDEMGIVLKIIAKNYPYLCMKYIEGNPAEGQFRAVFSELDTCPQAYEIYSRGEAIGIFEFEIEAIDGDTEYKSFTFYRTSNVKESHRGKRYYRYFADDEITKEDGSTIQKWKTKIVPVEGEDEPCCCQGCGCAK